MKKLSTYSILHCLTALRPVSSPCVGYQYLLASVPPIDLIAYLL